MPIYTKLVTPSITRFSDPIVFEFTVYMHVELDNPCSACFSETVSSCTCY